MKSLAILLLDKFMKDLIIQILAMVSEQERNENKRRQAQGIQVAKEKGVYKGHPLLYSTVLKILKTYYLSSSCRNVRRRSSNQ